MKEILITSAEDSEIISQLHAIINGDLVKNDGEGILIFNNDFGKGIIRNIGFEWGLSLLDFDVVFKEDIKITFKSQATAVVKFVFISQGSFRYRQDVTEPYLDLEQYQNIILSPKRGAERSFLFPSNKHLKINFIRVVRKEYLKKKKNNIIHLNNILGSVFKDSSERKPYAHGGNFSLKIADQIKELGSVETEGALRTLSLEGRLYLILSLQLLEHHNFETETRLPESLSKSDIIKIHKLSAYILENISGTITIDTLCSESCLSPKKLQLGFKVLYSKTVNEYVRQIKLEISRDYLKNTELSISEIVYAIGIKSRSYFSKIFSEEYNMLPTEYRKQLRLKKTN